MSRLLFLNLLRRKTIVRYSTLESAWTGDIEFIRNFSIIAHVDHGKSTLADRILEDCGATIENKQSLDTLDVERQRGITVKSVAASVNYNYNGNSYLFNLIDTPGHIDFNWEVQRSLTACEGVILVVDATEGIQAQTMTNFFLAFELDLEIICVLNKCDLDHADTGRCKKELLETFDIDPASVIEISAKQGLNVKSVLDAIALKIPPPKSKDYDSYWCFDAAIGDHGGNVYYIKNCGNEILKPKTRLLINDGKQRATITVKDVGLSMPGKNVKLGEGLMPGQIGYFTGNSSSGVLLTGHSLSSEIRDENEDVRRIKPMKPVVFTSFYPASTASFKGLEKSVDALILNDPVVTTQYTYSDAHGSGVKLGFLGKLHLEVFAQRLMDEFDANFYQTSPTVAYRAKLKVNKKKFSNITQQLTVIDHDEQIVQFDTAASYVPASLVDSYYEQYTQLQIITPSKFYEDINEVICVRKRGEFVTMENLGTKRLILHYLVPLIESMTDLHGLIKSVSSGFASFEMEDGPWRETDIQILSISLDGQIIPELQFIVQSHEAIEKGTQLVKKFKSQMPMQEFPVKIAAHVTNNFDMQKKQYGKQFATTKTNYLRKNTTKISKSNKTIAADRQGKLKKKERERIDTLRSIGNIKLPENLIQTLANEI